MAMSNIGKAKRAEVKSLVGCVKSEIQAGHRDGTIAKMLEGIVTTKDWVTAFRWYMEKNAPKARRY